MTHLNMKNLSKETTLACIMPGFPDYLFSVSSVWCAGLQCTFTPTNICTYDPKTNVVKLQGWRDLTSRLWHFPVCEILCKKVTPIKQVFQQVFLVNSACYLPSISALITSHYATVGFPVNCGNWSGWTAELARRHCANSEETVLGTMSQKRKTYDLQKSI